MEMNEPQARREFRAWIELIGSQRAAAKNLKVSLGYVNDMVKGRRRLSAGALRRIGLRRVVKEVYKTR